MSVSTFFSSGGPKLKCADLLAHVVEVLQNSFSCAAYGEDYSSILLKNILSVRKYWCEITQQQWHCEYNIDIDINIVCVVNKSAPVIAWVITALKSTSSYS